MSEGQEGLELTTDPRELRRRWGLRWVHGCGFPGSFSSVSSCGFETRSWPVCRWGWRSYWSLGGALGSDTCWRGIPSPTPRSGALCKGTFSFCHFLRLTSCLLAGRSSSLKGFREIVSVLTQSDLLNYTFSSRNLHKMTCRQCVFFFIVIVDVITHTTQWIKNKSSLSWAKRATL